MQPQRDSYSNQDTQAYLSRDAGNLLGASSDSGGLNFGWVPVEQLQTFLATSNLPKVFADTWSALNLG